MCTKISLKNEIVFSETFRHRSRDKERLFPRNEDKGFLVIDTRWHRRTGSTLGRDNTDLSIEHLCLASSKMRFGSKGMIPDGFVTKIFL